MKVATGLTQHHPKRRQAGRSWVLLGWAAIALATLDGCILGGPETIEPSSSYPHLGVSRRSRRLASSLVISTVRFVDMNLGNPDDGALVRPTGYTIYDALGNKLQYVRNYIGVSDTDPTILDMEPGSYLKIGRASCRERV